MSQRFTGYERSRNARRHVVWGDRIAKTVISVGGIGTILAIGLVMVFLFMVALPLFRGAKTHELSPLTLPAQTFATGTIRQAGVDEYGVLSWFLKTDGKTISIEVFDLSTGTSAGTLTEILPSEVTAFSFQPESRLFALGLANGSVQTGTVSIATRFVQGPDEALPPATVRSLTESGDRREHQTSLKLVSAIPAISGAIVRIAVGSSSDGLHVAILGTDHNLSLLLVKESKNFLTGEISSTTQTLPVIDSPFPEQPAFLLLSGDTSQILVAWKSGRLVRFNVRKPEAPKRAEERMLLEASEPRGELTALQYLLGGTTLLGGDSNGRVFSWFPMNPGNPSEVDSLDGTVMVKGHEFDPFQKPVHQFAISTRSRMFAVSDTDGHVRLIHGTSEKDVFHTTLPSVETAVMAFGPKEDRFISAGGTFLHAWSLHLGHPEVSFTSLVRPIWYERHQHPMHVWQSSSGTDDFEPKYGLMPLIFGTLKATLYSLLIGVPIALLAAIYTSEFLHPKARTKIKPAIELMASLPSVVLGFLAALVFAPFVETHLCSILAGICILPVSFLTGAYFWQLLPSRTSRIYAWLRVPLSLLLLVLTCLLARGLGHPTEKLLFAGNAMLWLDGQIGSAVGGWFLLLLPFTAVFCALAIGRWVNPALRDRSRFTSRQRLALIDAGKFATGLLATVLLSLGFSFALSWLGFDPRHSVFGTYVQRNSLVVGFVMGFAIIPIIYTIADDALATVPQNLRSASLGAGATPWQTAIRVVIPTAMSGLFSAIMIGLGRAVGETMIVLMAAGNTPVMDWNIFNGFRTLSANLAVELPEAVRNSTHYRTLFLAAFALFIVTFILNTLAEFVRLRFRKRAVQL